MIDSSHSSVVLPDLAAVAESDGRPTTARPSEGSCVGEGSDGSQSSDEVRWRTGSDGFDNTDGSVVEIPIRSLLPADSPRLTGPNFEHVRILAETEGELPPIIVHADSKRLIIGEHRRLAALMRGEETIRAKLYRGSEGSAFVMAVRSNVKHGLPLSMAERKAAAARILQFFPAWSDRAIASVSGLSHKTVAMVRSSSTAGSDILANRIGQDGRVRAVQISEKRHRASEMLKENPEATLRKVAEATGLSPTTVRDVKSRMNRGEDPVIPRQRTRDSQPRKRVRTTPINEGWDPLCAIRNLKVDPSFRFNQAGQLLLRSLDAPVNMPEHDLLISRLPSHCSGVIARLAAHSAAWWQEFERKLSDHGDFDEVGEVVNACD